MVAKTVEELKEYRDNSCVTDEEVVACALVIIAERLEWIASTLEDTKRLLETNSG